MKIYAVIGQSMQTILPDDMTYNPTENEILMTEERPDGDYVAAADGTWVQPEPSVDEQIAELMAQYEADKATLMSYFLTAIIENDTDTQTEIRTEIAELDAAYDSDIAELLSDEEDEEE